MPNRIEYKKGDIVGSHGMIFISDCDSDISCRQAIFKCKCNCEFKNSIADIRNNNRKDCGCKHKRNSSHLGLKKGDIVGKLVFIEYINLVGKNKKAKFICSCGKEFINYIFMAKKNISCGIYCVDKMNNTGIIVGYSKYPEYKNYICMKSRIFDKNNPSYDNYGGRGLTISEDWKTSFLNFYKDMGNKPSSKHSVERIDNSKGYCKENCKWATAKEQCNNVRTNRNYTYKGETKTISQWADKFGLKPDIIFTRLKRGWSGDDLFRIPSKKRRKK